VRDLEPSRPADASALEFGQRGVEVLNAVYQHRLVPREVFGQQEGRRLGVHPHQRHPGSERLDGKPNLAAQPGREMAKVARDIAAR